jgi:hypothetical protein
MSDSSDKHALEWSVAAIWITIFVCITAVVVVFRLT